MLPGGAITPFKLRRSFSSLFAIRVPSPPFLVFCRQQLLLGLAGVHAPSTSRLFFHPSCLCLRPLCLSVCVSFFAEVKQKGAQVARRVGFGAVILLAAVIGGGYLLGKRAAAGRGEGSGERTGETGKHLPTIPRVIIVGGESTKIRIAQTPLLFRLYFNNVFCGSSET